jgi:hypothetical protein
MNAQPTYIGAVYIPGTERPHDPRAATVLRRLRERWTRAREVSRWLTETGYRNTLCDLVRGGYVERVEGTFALTPDGVTLALVDGRPVRVAERKTRAGPTPPETIAARKATALSRLALGPASTCQLATALRESRDNARYVVRLLAADGLIERIGRGNKTLWCRVSP